MFFVFFVRLTDFFLLLAADFATVSETVFEMDKTLMYSDAQ